MKKIFLFLKATVIGGVWFLIPLVVFLVVLEKAQNLTSRIITPVAERLPVESVLGVGLPRLLALFVIVLFCFLVGLLAKTAAARKIIVWLESTLLSNLPGYDFMKSMGANLIGVEQYASNPVVLARIEEAWQIGFLMETLDNGLHAVFVPGAPSPWSGSVYFMTADRFRRLDISQVDAMKCVRRLGIASNKLLAGHLPKQ